MNEVPQYHRVCVEQYALIGNKEAHHVIIFTVITDRVCNLLKLTCCSCDRLCASILPFQPYLTINHTQQPTWRSLRLLMQLVSSDQHR